MDDGEVPEVEKRINAWRQSERKIMIDTLQDLVRTAHKHAKSQYTPHAQRARWTRLAGQLIWYEDLVLKSFSLEALTIEMQDLKKQVRESEKERARQSLTMSYSPVGFRKPGDKKTDAEKAEDEEDRQDEEASEAVEAVEPAGAREVA